VDNFELNTAKENEVAPVDKGQIADVLHTAKENEAIPVDKKRGSFFNCMFD
jgi:hypothetical protein